MNIILAQVTKDIQCQRRPLILWGICLAVGFLPMALVKLFTGFHEHGITDAHTIVSSLSLVALALSGSLAAGFGFLLLVPVLVVRIVHEDTLLGTTAFWLTRPMPREKLLAAKALFIAILPLPLILLGIKVGTGHFWANEFAWIAAFAAIAAITSGLRDFLSYGLALLFGKAIFGGILEKLWAYFHGGSSILTDAEAQRLDIAGKTLHLNAPDLFHLCYLAGFLVVLIHQYLTLKTRRSLALIVTLVVAVSLIHMLAGPFTHAPAVH